MCNKHYKEMRGKDIGFECLRDKCDGNWVEDKAFSSVPEKRISSQISYDTTKLVVYSFSRFK